MLPDHPAGVIDLLDRAIRLCRAQPGLALGGVAVPLMLLGLLAAVGLELAIGPTHLPAGWGGLELLWLAGAVNDAGGAEPLPSSLLAAGTFLVLYGVASPVAAGALYVALDASCRGRSMTTAQAYRRLSGRMGRYLGVVALRGVVVALGLLCFVVPGIVFALVLSQADVAAVLEGRAGVAALARSRALMRDGPARLRVLLLTLCLIIAGILLGQILYAGYGVLAGDAPDGFVASVLVAAAAWSLMLPLQAAAMLLFYHDLRVRYEALDLELEASRLGLDMPVPGGEGT
jgi:hypothetical protein